MKIGTRRFVYRAIYNDYLDKMITTTKVKFGLPRAFVVYRDGETMPYIRIGHQCQYLGEYYSKFKEICR